MKVTEKGTDRHAEVHLCVQERVEALEEYGQYIDARDKAVCAYVPVDEGHKVKIDGRFSGTTLTIAYDAVIDGVHRKASSYSAKSVHNQKNKKLDTDSFLYSTNKGLVETIAQVAPLSGVTTSRGEGPETVGTIELRLYITRQLGVSHAVSNLHHYSNDKGNVEDEVRDSTTYRKIEPTFRIEFEKDSAPLEMAKSNRELRKMEAKRPGTEPWAIFRFHYRSKGKFAMVNYCASADKFPEAILEHDLKQTYGPTSKEKTDPHTLELDPVPSLLAGTKPLKDDGDSSTRTSSPAPPDQSSVPTKRPRKDPALKPPTIFKQQELQVATTPAPPPRMTSPVEKEKLQLTRTSAPQLSMTPVADQETGKTPVSETQANDTAALLENVFPRPSPKLVSSEVSAATVDKIATTGVTDSTASSSKVNVDTAKNNDTVKNAVPSNNAGGKIVTNGAHKSTAATESVEKSIEKPVEKAQAGSNDTIAVALPKGSASATTKDSAAKTSSLTETSSKPTIGTTTQVASSATQLIKKDPKVVIPLRTNRPASKPVPISDSTQITPKNPDSTILPITPSKRPIEATSPINPENKRQKSLTTPPPHLSPTSLARRFATTPSPRPISLEQKVAEKRKQLLTLRQKRLETAKKQDELDRKMEPHKQRLAEELERLDREMKEEEEAALEEEECLRAGVEMLSEFERE